MSLSFFLKLLTQDLKKLGSRIGRLISKALGPGFCILGSATVFACCNLDRFDCAIKQFKDCSLRKISVGFSAHLQAQ